VDIPGGKGRLPASTEQAGDLLIEGLGQTDILPKLCAGRVLAADF
jgi:hypothetical protein